MNNVQEFLYENSPIRMIESNGETWWVLKDICKLLSIENHKNITKRLEEDEVGTFELPHPQSKEKKLEMLCVNESGLYSVILRSDKPEAKAFDFSCTDIQNASKISPAIFYSVDICNV